MSALNQLGRGLGTLLYWIMLIVGGLFLFAAVIILFQNKPEDRDALAGCLLIGGVFAVPGYLLRRKVLNSQSQDALMLQLEGFLRLHDRFTLAEFSQKVGKSQLESEALIQKLVVERNIPLVFHRRSGEYLQRGRITTRERVVEKCPSCGGNLGSEVFMEGEIATCRYCGTSL